MNQNPQKEAILWTPPGVYVSILCSHFSGTRFVGGLKPKQVPFYKRYPVWHISGNKSTDRLGEDSLHINSYLCYPICDIGENIDKNKYHQAAIISQSANFFATPITESPVFVAYQIQSTRINTIGDKYLDIFNGELMPHENKEYDIQIKIFSWNLDGTRAANVKYSWVCIAGAALRASFVY